MRRLILHTSLSSGSGSLSMQDLNFTLSILKRGNASLCNLYQYIKFVQVTTKERLEPLMKKKKWKLSQPPYRQTQTQMLHRYLDTTSRLSSFSRFSLQTQVTSRYPLSATQLEAQFLCSCLLASDQSLQGSAFPCLGSQQKQQLSALPLLQGTEAGLCSKELY